MLYEAEHTIHL